MTENIENQKIKINEYQNKYYHDHMTNDEWRKHRAEVVLNNMRKMRSKKKEELLAQGIIIKMGRKKHVKVEDNNKNINLPSHIREPPELFNIVV